MEALRDALGPNLTQAHKRVSAMLKAYKMNALFDNKQLRELLKHSPGRRIKAESVVGFMKAKRPPYNRPCLYAVVRPVTIRSSANRHVDFSWVKCLRNIFDKHDKSKVKRQRAIGAFRVEAERCKSMIAAHERYDVGECDACGKICKLAVDHDGKPFALIVDEFLASKGLTLEGVVLEWNGVAHGFRCRQLASEWHKWHDANATLVGLCCTCNSSKGSGGYRHKKS
jgi:hypothetical protein